MIAVDIENPQQLVDYLRRTQRIRADEQPRMRRLDGGVSNRTIWLERASGEAWVIKQALEKLRVTVDWFSDPQRIHREALGLRWLKRLAPAPAIVDFLFEDHQHHILAMAAVPEPHENWKTLLLGGDVRTDHVRQFARLLATVHKNAYANRQEIAQVFAERGFFESLRLEPYYSYTAAQVAAAAPVIHDLIDETRRRRITLVHGDYSPKNVLVQQGRLILLDHEVIHFGDPAFDLGFSLTHFLSKAHHLPEYRALFIDAAVRYWTTYREVLSRASVPWWDPLQARAVRHTLACLLARVAGRSPLEYLGDAERARQGEIVLQLMARMPTRIEDLIEDFNHALKP